MKVAIFGHNCPETYFPDLQALFTELYHWKIQVAVFGGFIEELNKQDFHGLIYDEVFDEDAQLGLDISLLISVGGDGTFLDTLRFVGDQRIPVMGVHTGRLGFLANILPEQIPNVIASIAHGKYSYEERSLLQLDAGGDKLFDGMPLALNDVTIQKSDSNLITIRTFADGRLLNAYWADGLIISTPTGSTAYSLSVGGPIVAPTSGVISLCPIASHNLSIRPLIISDQSKLEFEIETRSGSFLATVDNRTEKLSDKVRLVLQKAESKFHMLTFADTDFYATLRNKLMWGIDKRN